MTATISPCGKYRYTLHRPMHHTGQRVCVVMVNPSTADATENDATIRKLLGFANRHGWRNFTVVNLFAYRATDVKVLATVSDPVGPGNNHHLVHAMACCDLIVVAWGRVDKVPPALRDRWRYVAKLAATLGRPVKCWGTCADGHPCHPVMLGYDTPLVDWSAPL